MRYTQISKRLPYSKPVLLFCNAIGDHLLALPAIRALVELFPGSLSLICGTDAGQTYFRGIKLRSIFETRFTYRVDGCHRFNARKAATAIRECDLLLSMNPWHSRDVEGLTRILSPKASIGYFPGFDYVLPLDWEKHSADLMFDLPRIFRPDLDITPFAYLPSRSRRDQRDVDSLLAILPKDLKILGVHSESKPEKMWSALKLSQVIKIFLDRHPDFVVFLFDRGANGLADIQDDRVISLRGTPLTISLGLVEQLDLFLGVDSSMLHAADLARVPGVGLFGPTRPLEWGFRFGAGCHIDCGPSMRGGSVTKVLADLEHSLGPSMQYKPRRSRA